MKDVFIVSAWGRGAFLAHRLARHFSVSFLDLSPLFSNSLPEIEGPFGVFLPENLDDNKRQYLCGDLIHMVPQGFCVLNPKGIFEFQGAMSSFFMKKPEAKFAHSFFSNWKKEKHNKEDEELAWLIRLAEQMGSSVLSPERKKNSSYFYSPIFSPYALKESSFRYFENLQKNLSYQGIECFTIDSSMKLDVQKKSVCIKTNQMQKEAKHLVWALSGPETNRYFPSLMNTLFPNWEKPKWIWQRFSLSWDDLSYEGVIPSIFLLQTEISSPCLLGNTMIVKKNPNSHEGDLWKICPYSKRFDKKIMISELQSALCHLRQFFPFFSIEASLPDENFCHDYFVLYEKSGMRKSISKPVFHLNPEASGKLDDYSLLQYAELLFQELLKEKNA